MTKVSHFSRRVRENIGILQAYSRFMFRRSRLAMGLWILAIVLVAMRMSGIHVHLCSDGQEAPVAVHLLDGSLHHETETSEGAEEHQDQDVDVFGAALFKKSDAGGDLLPLAFIFVLLLLLPHARYFFPILRASALPVGPTAYFTPPLRGPPR